MAVLSRDEILAVHDTEIRTVKVPDWKGEVCLRSLAGDEIEAWEDSIAETTKRGDRKLNFENVRAKLLALVIVDENGRCLFTEADIKALGKKRGRALNQLFQIAQEMNGLSKEDIERLSEGN